MTRPSAISVLSNLESALQSGIEQQSELKKNVLCVVLGAISDDRVLQRGCEVELSLTCIIFILCVFEHIRI